ncbi:hypothetical protein HAX54_019687, partial [Datura stramonium]|nr:hypothetical protein [Datura stramonium]
TLDEFQGLISSLVEFGKLLVSVGIYYNRIYALLTTSAKSPLWKIIYNCDLEWNP